MALTAGEPRYFVSGREFESYQAARQWAIVHVVERLAVMQELDRYTPAYVLEWVTPETST